MKETECAKWKYGQETEEILDFANMVFSMSYGRTNFASLLPKAYSEPRCIIPTHYIIKESNRIKALVDSYPVTMKLNGENSRKLKAAYVGTVSVHPGARGKGYMIELMKQAEEDALRQGCALMILDGERHRYQYYGFERAGIRYSFEIETNNIKHCCSKKYDKAYMTSPMYSFEELEEQSSWLDYLYKLYQRRNVTARTLEDFWLCLQSYNATAYAVLKDDKPVGYINLSEDAKNISEFELDEIQELPRVIYDLMMDFDMEQVGISVGIDETDKIEQLQIMCDYCNASMSHMIKILDYEAVLEFLLRWKQKYCVLATGDYVAGIRDSKTGNVRNFMLSVSGEQVSVSQTEQAADTVFEMLEFVRMVTTNLCFVEYQKGEQSKIKNAPTGWFPLPFYLPEADTF